ncbi:MULTISPECIES: 4'-phosphopantetheinyl transferase family protein [Pseudomonas aeruginosa group]|uniref:4'-phosphopantetheinyl transferase family protein n=1 Tax=Pseudomonas aeruginosa group TaxID=136841 RepID=UPI001A1C6548|nr:MULTISPECIES: 4'-phosphopantetheinyl transferase superfamily protein [Pseudomonas aeruginosa group]MBG6886130.1 4'-phosphopantetheinyl transferase superfamily protein [Pseudomonas aeruginosa]MCY0315494.1 4'-phosphopantetheinyl transferase superfamily protein [Pseudomonas aeruginosa]MCY0517485.1 4'-phosphopantetheinyl transferase superfamily protein [Pseudomonas aeruginosa]MDI3610670.1 4'-phosphopantetheinyl transferase superfamily protein [Pseudomonas aeruginosa]MDI3677547.1 4'-phosphopante
MIACPLVPVAMTLPGPGCVDLWRLSTSEGMRRPARAGYLQWLGPQELARYQARADLSWREQFLTGHGWLREVLARYLECEPARITLGRWPHGKPELADPGHSALHFNLSHSQGWLVLAVSASPVGVDVEAHQPRDVQELCRRFFSVGEQRALSRTVHSRRLAHFYRLWTLKEAWAKATGVGICQQWRQVRIARGRGRRVRPGQVCWRLAASDSLDGYSLAVAGLSPRTIRIRTFVDTALAGYGLCRDNPRWLEHHPSDGDAGHMRYTNQGVTL